MWYSNDLNLETMTPFNYTSRNETLADSNHQYISQNMMSTNHPIKKMKIDTQYAYNYNNSFEYDHTNPQFNYSSGSLSFNSSSNDSNLNNDSNETSYSNYLPNYYYSNSNFHYECEQVFVPDTISNDFFTDGSSDVNYFGSKSLNENSTQQIEKHENKTSGLKFCFEDLNLWKSFNQIGTEMIANRTGRRLFPVIRISLQGLEPNSLYTLSIDMVLVDNLRHKFTDSKWATEEDVQRYSRNPLKIPVSANFIHPDSPQTGGEWMKKIVSFHKLKITNSPGNPLGQVSLNLNHKYLPRLHVYKDSDLIETFVLSEATFVSVTSYQNEEMVKLKIKHNPFARGHSKKRNSNND